MLVSMPFAIGPGTRLMIMAIDEYVMHHLGRPANAMFFFATEFVKSIFLPCRSSTITGSCESRPMG